MPFTVQCSSCRSKFAMPDAVYEQRIAGRVVDVACKHCKHSIRVDGTQPRAATDSAPSPGPAQVGALENAAPKQAHGSGELPAIAPVRAIGVSPERAGTPMVDLPSVKPAAPTAPTRPLPATNKANDGAGRSLKVPLPGGGNSLAAGFTGISRLPNVVRAAAPVVESVNRDAPVNPLGSTLIASSPVMVSKSVSLSFGPTKPVQNAEEPSSAPLPEVFDDSPTEVMAQPKVPPPLPKRRSGERPEVPVAAPPPPPRRNPGLKATMMGVAPPANHERRLEPAGPGVPPSSRRKALTDAVDSVAVGTVKSAQLSPQSGFTPAGVTSAQVVDVLPSRPAAKAPLRLDTGGTMMGLAPPSEAARLQWLKSESSAAEPAVQDPAAAAASKTLTTAASAAQDPVAAPAFQAPAFQDPAAASAARMFDSEAVVELAAHAPATLAEPALTQPQSLLVATDDLPSPAQHLALSALSERLTIDDAVTEVTQEPRAPEVASLAQDWDSGTSDVSPQISQAVPTAPQATSRRRGRWALVALVALLGGGLGAVGAVVTGRVQLPAEAQARVSQWLPVVGLHVTKSVTGHAAQSPAVTPAPAVPAEAAEELEADLPASDWAVTQVRDTIGPPPAAAAAIADSAEVEGPVEGVAAQASGKSLPKVNTGVEEASAGPASAAKPSVAAAAANTDEAGAGSTIGSTASGVSVASGSAGSGSSGSPVVGQPGFAQPVSGVPDGVDITKVQYLMNLAVSRARNCHLGGRATGAAKVLVTFGPDGRVQEAKVQGEPIASAPVSRCILTFARGVAIKPFEGDPFTVSQSIILR